ncbi:hypothetical protein JDV02_009787 [Purpureocillium takamizusanense]|uniref:Uncharacterized protein n=1 Tax=Purpureocillium takamizusanense TaxID=2060973 RepID=A0A9Q8VG01_9HYPO|nr:uncharacterized protein JDV02_009787 [Purpureocillium takamizusanense]UNI24006.1 hypothetical protein JDV02_009787 [Purpureocillium takamizusanense]
MPNPPTPPPPPGLHFVNVQGLQRVNMMKLESRTYIQILPNTELFASLAVAVNIGLEMAESPRARQVLAQLGRAVIDSHAANAQGAHMHGVPAAPPVADPNPSNMDWHVSNFLRAIRGDFPGIVVGARDLTSPDQLAATNRTPWWTGSWEAFNPKDAGVIYFNDSRVNDMVAAHVAASKASRGSAAADRYSQRWRDFLFVFASATLHELAHFFLGYLSGNGRPYTPDQITHLGYGSKRGARGNIIPGGESGRWLENMLYGGSIEFYADESQNTAQAGIPHLVDQQAVARQILPTTIHRFITDPRTYEFPFPVSSRGLTQRDRARQGIRTIGAMAGRVATESSPSQTVMRTMAAARDLPVYFVRIDELRRRPAQPQLPLKVERMRV